MWRGILFHTGEAYPAFTEVYTSGLPSHMALSSAVPACAAVSAAAQAVVSTAPSLA
jgi:hypothetical protein